MVILYILGGLPYRNNISTDDLDTLFTNGCYYIPSSGSLGLGPASVMVFKWASGTYNYCQIVSSIGGTTMKIRYYSNSVWMAWQTIERNIPDFYKNYNDLSSLASALKTVW